MSFDYKDMEKLRDNMIALDKRSNEFIRKFLLEMALRALAKTKQRTPVDTGTLRNNWTIGNGSVSGETKIIKSGKNKGKSRFTVDKEKSVQPTIDGIRRVGDKLEIDIFNNVEYASHVEYGHKTRSGGFVEGRFMCRLSIDDIEKEIPARWDRAFKQFISTLGF